MPTPSLGPSLPPAEQHLNSQSGALSVASCLAKTRSPRNLLFSILVIVLLYAFWTPLRALVHYSLWGYGLYDKYSYTMAIPFLSMTLVIFERRKIFASVQNGFRGGVILLLTGLAISWSGGLAQHRVGADVSFSLKILALVICWLAAFVLCYGARAFRAGAFPLLFLFLTVPVPDSLLDKPITAVQYGSTEVCFLVFSLAGVPALRNGLGFTLSNVSIEVAKECSGIHSTLAIFIVSLIAGHLFLPLFWKKVLLVLLALPVVCVTNGLRIAGLTVLAEYVDPSWLHGSLHRQGGMGFFLLALALLFAILHPLRRA